LSTIYLFGALREGNRLVVGGDHERMKLL